MYNPLSFLKILRSRTLNSFLYKDKKKKIKISKMIYSNIK